MGKESDAVQGYLDNREHFADLFNGCYFGGEQVVLAEELTEGSEVYNQEYQKMLFWGEESENQEKGNKRTTAPRTRDLKKRLKSGGCLRVLAIEHQNAVDYTMPWRHMYYDALEYGKQIREISSDNKREKKLKPGAEFLCGLKEGDRLAPAFTACLYLGTEPWTGPRSLREMMSFGEDEERWQELFADYQFNLICVNEMTDFSVFHTPLKQLLKVVANRGDKKKLINDIMNNPEFAEVDSETARVAGIVLGEEIFMEKKIKEEGEKVNMCRALREWREETREKDIAEGRGLLNNLNKRLIEEGRLDDLVKAVNDIPYQNQLLEEYGLA